MIITNDMRGRITQALLQHAFADQLGAFLARERDLATRIYERAYPAAVRKAMDVVEAAYPASFHTRQSAIVNAAGQKITVGNGGRSGGRGNMQDVLPAHENATLRIVEAHRYSEPMLSLEAGDALAAEVQAYGLEREQLNEQVSTRRAEIVGVLKDIRTDKQLRERWPETLPIAAPLLKIPEKPQLPMVPLADLNAALGLPVAEAE